MAVGQSHSEGSLIQNPVGGLRVLGLKILALTRGGPCPLIVGSGLPKQRHPWCAIVHVIMGQHPPYRQMSASLSFQKEEIAALQHALRFVCGADVGQK